MPDKHALLGPSSSHRWLACTPCARLEETFPSETSTYAEEGTRAHSLCEAKLRKLLNPKYNILVEPDDDEMEDCTEAYRDFVEEELNAAKAKCPSAALLIEQAIDFSDYVPDGFGTSDAVIVADDVLTVIDFKYGKGVAVDATDNPQLKLYALGSYLALCNIYDFTTVKMLVFQPRINNIGSFEIAVPELLNWAETYVKPRAKLAYAGEGDFVPGDHCKFCKARAVCKARVESIFPVINHEKVLAPVLTDVEIPALMAQFDATRDWMDAVEAYAQANAINEGHKWEGYKLVESRTLRKIPNQIEAALRLEKCGYTKDEFTKVTLKGLGELEKLLGKKQFATVLGDLVVKPVGSPTLVKIKDKRPEITNPLENVFKEEM